MADQLQLRGGTAAQNNVFTGAQREVTINTDDHSLVIHDGITPGGFPTASRAQVNNGTFYFNDDTVAGSAANAYILAAKSNTNRPTQYLDGQQFGFVTANANTSSSNANFSGLGVKNLKYPGGVDPAAGDIFGRVYLIYDAANDWLEIQRKVTTPLPQVRPITGSVSGNALTVGLPATIMDFRSPSLNNGAVNSRTIVAPLTLTVPGGATLGTVSAVESIIVILAIDIGTGVELAVVNKASNMNFDETTLINTTAIGAASNSASVIYSQTARSGVPFRVVGYIRSTQTTAGAWATQPAQVQGQGGQNIIRSDAVFSREFVSAQQTITVAGQLVIAHGLTINGVAVPPKLVTLDLICITADVSYSVGMVLSCVMSPDTGANDGVSLVRDSTNITIRFGSGGGLPLLDYNTGSIIRMTPSRWRLVARAYA